MKRSPWNDIQPVLRAFLRAQPGLMAGGALLAVLTVLMGMGLLGLSGWFITATALAGLSPATAIVFDVFMPSAGIRLLALGRTLSRYGERLVTHDATLAVVAGLREQLFRGWAQPEAARQLLLRPARLLFRLTVDMDALESVYLRLLVPLAATLGAVLLAALVLGSLQWWWGVWLALWLLATGTAIVIWLAPRAVTPAVRRALATEALRAHTVDLLAGQTELAMGGRLTAQCDLLARADQRLARADDALNRLEVAASAGHSLVGTLTLVAVLLGVGALVGEGAIGAPAAALALLVALTATEPFAALRRGALESGRTWLAARRLAPRMAGAAEPVAPPAGARDADTDGMAVALHDITWAHSGSAVPIFAVLSLQLAPGERVALVGPSGAGKSTLLALVAGELRPQSGTVQAQSCSWLTQRTELFQDTLAENLRLAQPQADDMRLWQVLQDAGLHADVQALTARLETPLGEGGLGLSGGQSRRLALARLLLRDVPLWLLDEPTEALDAATAQDVLLRLSQQARGRSLLIATHLRREAALADRLVCLQAGQIVAEVRRGSAEFEAVLQTLRAD
ncbi:amino acid ABC transporter ATP-binding/permease protein [Simplicispira psychrophila]|uniref:amino acid ABC transporter ATP-binding/permease protein n=1 Tax=Simplicispira psychrophila TaxID=80882 RepID=UPI00047F1D92|nr:ATP-binding cassette domain-containing protein [Simplicispira psychrophila]